IGEYTSLHGAGKNELLAALTNRNLFWRNHAQRLLVERGNKDIFLDLADMADNKAVDEIKLNPGAIHAVWTAMGIDPKKGCALALFAMDSPSAGVRRNALGALALEGQVSLTDFILAKGVVSNRDSQVRLAAFLALATKPEDAEAGKVI